MLDLCLMEEVFLKLVVIGFSFILMVIRGMFFFILMVNLLTKPKECVTRLYHYGLVICLSINCNEYLKDIENEYGSSITQTFVQS